MEYLNKETVSEDDFSDDDSACLDRNNSINKTGGTLPTKDDLQKLDDSYFTEESALHARIFPDLSENHRQMLIEESAISDQLIAAR